MNEITAMANMEGVKILTRNLEKDDWLDCIAEGIDELSVTERLIISLFYYESLTIKEISLVLEMPESEVSKIHYDKTLELLNK